MDKNVLGDQLDSTKVSSTGFQVLVVDNSSTCLKIAEVMLQTCKYEVAVQKASDALTVLRKKPEEFNIILTEVHMPEMNGFELLEKIKAEFKLPVVMMSSDTSNQIAWRCLQQGALIYFVKPLTINDVSMLWQYVFLKRDPEYKWKMGSVFEGSRWAEKVIKKGIEHTASVNKEITRSQIKRRMVWNAELHSKFERVVQEIGIKEATPKKILERLNEPGLEQKHVASHLQKYRLYLKSRENEEESDDGRSLSTVDEGEDTEQYTPAPEHIENRTSPPERVEPYKPAPAPACPETAQERVEYESHQNYIDYSSFQMKAQNGFPSSMGTPEMINQQPQQMLTTEAPVSLSGFEGANQFPAISSATIQQSSSSLQPPGYLQNYIGVGEADDDYMFNLMSTYGHILQDL